MIKNLLLVGLGGFIGSILRYLSYFISKQTPAFFTTCLINIVGSLLIGMVIEIIASLVLKSNQTTIQQFSTLIIFVPLLSATAGNIGVQASAIVVQGLANGTLKEYSRQYLIKELSVALISGTIISLILFVYHSLMYQQYLVGFAISISIVVVLIFAAALGTLVPLFLYKNKIDPAIATGPFITSTNDVFGIIIYFAIARMILGF
jgi:magnesium transporter